jgi:hypothetical protein
MLTKVFCRDDSVSKTTPFCDVRTVLPDRQLFEKSWGLFIAYYFLLLYVTWRAIAHAPEMF